MDMKSGKSSRVSETEESNFLPMMSLCFLTLNAVVTFSRAHAHHDIPTMGFVLFLYFGFLSLFCCLKAFDRFSPHEDSPKKDLLKVAIWVLSTALNVGLAVKFAPLIHPIGAVFIYAVVAVTCGISFYFFFIYRADPKGHCGSCKSFAANKKNKLFLVSSSPLQVGQKDTKPLVEPNSPLENV